ncbi:MAG: hypothetical protein KGM24_14625, partial [Elusimicrobia bacterium]|nr:hypothetical protein [Elusimicrobiota bacterium]
MTSRLAVSLVLAAAAVAGAWTWSQARHERRLMTQELDRRGSILVESLRELSAPLVKRKDRAGLQRLLDRMEARERLRGIAVFGPDGAELASAGGPERLAAPAATEDPSPRCAALA